MSTVFDLKCCLCVLVHSLCAEAIFLLSEPPHLHHERHASLIRSADTAQLTKQAAVSDSHGYLDISVNDVVVVAIAQRLQDLSHVVTERKKKRKEKKKTPSGQCCMKENELF